MTTQEQFYEQIGRFIREQRAGKKLSQQDLSDESNVSKRAISKLEGGNRISEDNIESLLSYFKTTTTVGVIFRIEESDETEEAKED